MRYTFLTSGEIYYFGTDYLMANQFHGTRMDGSANQIYLRLYRQDGIHVYPLVGVKSESRLFYSEAGLSWQGMAGDVSYRVDFCPEGMNWIWRVTLQGRAEADLIYGQDLGVGSRWSVANNPLYNSQYVGHSVLTGSCGFVICSRQNSPIDGENPYAQMGMIGEEAIHFATDGLQFFGLEVKMTGKVQALQGDLPDQVLQYECAYGALQSRRFAIEGEKVISCYGMFRENHPDAVTEILEETDVLRMHERGLEDSALQEVHIVPVKPEIGGDYSSPAWSDDQIRQMYPQRKLEEIADGELLSFFTEDHSHVVTQAKEIKTQRPHGAIAMSLPDTGKVNSKLIASTHFIGGIFNSHVVIGNTDMNQMISNVKGFLNLQKNSGQRLYVRIDGIYRLLNLPAVYELGLNYSRWYYTIGEDVLRITSFCVAESTDVVLDVKSMSDRKYDFILTSQLIMGGEDYETEIHEELIERGIRFRLNSDTYPDTYYDMLVTDGDYIISDDRIFFEDGKSFDEAICTISMDGRCEFRVVIHGHLEGEEEEPRLYWCFEEQKRKGLDFYRDLTAGFNLSGGDELRSQILNETALWYAENAMVHFASPHGLEQSGGAAWGARDVCQGPMEFFLAVGKFTLARNVLLRIFAAQYLESQEWPQWFMFDKYDMDAGECHGDVIFWPLKALADYLDCTADVSILKEKVPYCEEKNRAETLLQHIYRAVENIETTRLIGSTGLISYAGGDWDDTLQPADPKMRDFLVSAWTQALAYQTFTELAPKVAEVDEKLSEKLQNLAQTVKTAWDQYLVKNDVIAGFLSLEGEDGVLLHPEDHNTGIHYRLLPMTRSIIAELVDEKQALENEKIIENKLTFPDGIRLMDRPASYEGGVSKLFCRAEQAANVGREISLQYTHAHIRFIEAMAKLGRADKAWNGLFVINPVLLQNTVPNAQLRQSNTYFSSSDGDFLNRYDYAERFEALRSGEIPVKAGWRLYSSGPGIYFRQLVNRVLGIRMCAQGLVIDPVLPAELDGMEFTYTCFGKSVKIRYHIGTGMRKVCCGGETLKSSALTNPYRSGAMLLDRKVMETCNGILDVYI